MNTHPRLHLLLSAALIGASVLAQSTPEFDLSAPSRRSQLPAELKEISALTDISPTTVACLQDEAGIIFYVDHTTGAITARMPFAGPGDYEGLTRIGSELYALRSDGLIYRLKEVNGAMDLLDTFRVDVPNRNLESLGYDERNKVLLIAAKDNLKGDEEQRDMRYIYGWDMQQGRQLPEPVLSLSVHNALAEAKALGVKVPMVEKKGHVRPRFKLRPSSIAVHPGDDNYWILSASDHALVVVDRAGKLKELYFLDPALYPQAEGITFLSTGDLLISSEGKESDAVLLFFERR